MSWNQYGCPPAWNEAWVGRNVDAGLTYQQFRDEAMNRMSDVAVVIERVNPDFDNRVGGGDDDIIKLFCH